MAVSNHLNNHVTMRLVDQIYIRETDRVFSDTFVFNPTHEWLKSIEINNKFKLEEIYKGKAVEDPTSGANFSLIRLLDQN